MGTAVSTWSLDREDRRRHTARGLGAALLSGLLPGLGQVVLGHRARGAAMVLVSLVLLGTGVWAAGETATVLAVLLRPDALPWLLAGNLALLVFRLVAALDAYVLGARPVAIPAVPRGVAGALGALGGLTVLIAAVALPHAAAGYATARTAGVVAAVFVEDAPRPAAEPPATSLPAAVEDTAAAATPPAATPSPAGEELLPDETPPVLPAPPPPPPNPWAEDDRLTVAILGSDAGPGRRSSRLDALLVASLDTRTGSGVVVSVDRYLAEFPLPDHLAELYAATCPFGDGWRYLNALYTCGLERIDAELAALYPDATDPAARAVADTLATLLELEVDHYALVDMAGFVGVVDALGGVELELSSPQLVRMSPAVEGEPWRVFDLPAGAQRLDGDEAIAYVRVRGSGGDRARMGRQRCLVAGALAAADVPSLLRGFPALATAIEEHLATDVPITALPALLELLLELEVGPIVADGFGPPDYRGSDHVPDVEAIRARTAALLAGEVEGAELEVGADGNVCP